jgi:collagenase-like PrtC family protease
LIRKIDKNIDIHCSSLNQVLNSESIKYWIENFNISRMIFPRNISAIEIKKLCFEFPNLEFEIFIKNDWCYNSD